MTKVVSTRLSETEHLKFLNRCNEKGCNSADLLRDIAIEFLNDTLKGNIVGVLSVDKDDSSSIKISSSRFVELNDADLIGLVASKDKPGNGQMCSYHLSMMIMKTGYSLSNGHNLKQPLI